MGTGDGFDNATQELVVHLRRICMVVYFLGAPSTKYLLQTYNGGTAIVRDYDMREDWVGSSIHRVAENWLPAEDMPAYMIQKHFYCYHLSFIFI